MLVIGVVEPQDRELLMELQYRFPIAPRPFKPIAERLGMDEEEVLQRVRRLKEAGIIKRIGFYVNYRSRRLVAALVAFSVNADKLDEARQISIRDEYISHSYLRDHPEYNLWIVIKRKSRGELEDAVQRIAERLGARDYIVLYGVKTYKLSVKYDLRRGISWSTSYGLPDKTPSPEELGVPQKLLPALRSLPIVKDPFKALAEKHGMRVEDLLPLIKKLLEAGVLGDPGAALDGDKLGFKYNGMVTLSCSDCCREIPRLVPESTHVVLREYPPNKWRYPCYFMVHAVRRELVDVVVERVKEAFPGVDVQVLYSVENLKPGVVR